LTRDRGKDVSPPHRNRLYPPSHLSNSYGGTISRKLKRPEREADPSYTSIAENKNTWSYIFNPLYIFMARYLNEHRNKFTFTCITAEDYLTVAFTLKLKTSIFRLIILPIFGILISWLNCTVDILFREA
jgi:hypothetical protein